MTGVHPAEPELAPAPVEPHDDVTVWPPHGYGDRARTELPVVVAWLHDYIGRPHRNLRRKGPICPFVPAAMKGAQVRYDFHYEVTGADTAELTAMLLHRLNAFPVPDTDGPSLESRVIILPDLGASGWAALDRAHAALKSGAVERGLMIGQFHPACDERSARNADFRVSRAPIPLLVVRRMASHDVLFLHQDPRWFAHYRRRFAEHYDSGGTTDPLMRTLYAQAQRHHSPGSDL
ncbi:DUF6875 domain-containing protein [Streptomyces sp. NPDC020917]|uniref:DUF6875 domain-containing protein n=1 Tax=Streptomyces sp. NPDC020917 TaxID=3365102 RepID=UPI0037A9ED23